MKRIVIISCYPSGQREIEILNRCIEGFRHTGWHIMIVSHLPIDESTTNINGPNINGTWFEKNHVYFKFFGLKTNILAE